MFMVLSPSLRVIATQAMYAEQRQTAAHVWTKPTDLSNWPACRQLYIHHLHLGLLLLSPKADRPTHYAIPQRVEG